MPGSCPVFGYPTAMPFTSDQVAAQIARDQGMFQMQAQGSNLASELLRRGQDPQFGAPLMAGKAFNAIGAVGAPLGALGMGLAGLDPMSLGYKGFGAARALGMGYGVASGVALGAFGVGTAGMMGLSYVGSQLQAGASQQQQFVRGMQSSFNFQTPFGNGFTNPQLSVMGNNLRQMSGQVGPQGQIVGFEELSSLAQSMGRMGMVSGTQDLSSFTQNFRKMVTAVKNVAKELGTSLKEAQEMMAGMRNSGVFNVNEQQRMASEMRRFSIAGGLSTPELSQAAGIGSQISRAIGGKGAAGAFGGLRTIGQIGVAVEAGVLSDEDIYNTTGMRGAEGRQALASMQMQTTGAWLKTGRGRRFVASLAGANGQLDAASIRDWQNGNMGTGRTMQNAHRNLSGVGREDFIRNEGRLRGEAFAAFGGNIPAMALQQWAESKNLDIRDMDDRSMLFAQRQLGMDRDMIDSAVKMLNGMPEMMRQSKRATRLDGQRQEMAEFKRTSGFEGARRKFELTREHIQNKIQSVGQQAYSELEKEIDSMLQEKSGMIMRTASKDIDLAYDALRSGNLSARGARNAFGIGAQYNDLEGSVHKQGGLTGPTAKQFEAGHFMGLGSSMSDKMTDAGFGDLFTKTGTQTRTVTSTRAAGGYGETTTRDIVTQVLTDADVARGIKNANAFSEGLTRGEDSVARQMARGHQAHLRAIYDAGAGNLDNEARRKFVQERLALAGKDNEDLRKLAEGLAVDPSKADSYTTAARNLASIESGMDLGEDMRVGRKGLPKGLNMMGGGMTDAEAIRAAGGGKGFGESWKDSFAKRMDYDRSKSFRENMSQNLSWENAGKALLTVGSPFYAMYSMGAATVDALGNNATADRRGMEMLHSDEGFARAKDVLEGKASDRELQRLADKKGPDSGYYKSLMELNKQRKREIAGEKVTYSDEQKKLLTGMVQAVTGQDQVNYRTQAKIAATEASGKLSRMHAVGVLDEKGNLAGNFANLSKEGKALMEKQLALLNFEKGATGQVGEGTQVETLGKSIREQLSGMSPAALRELGQKHLDSGMSGQTYFDMAKERERTNRLAQRGNVGAASALGIKLDAREARAAQKYKRGDGRFASLLAEKLGISGDAEAKQGLDDELKSLEANKGKISGGAYEANKKIIEEKKKELEGHSKVMDRLKTLDAADPKDRTKALAELQGDPEVKKLLAAKGEKDNPTRHLSKISEDMAKVSITMQTLPSDIAQALAKNGFMGPSLHGEKSWRSYLPLPRLTPTPAERSRRWRPLSTWLTSPTTRSSVVKSKWSATSSTAQ